MLFFKIKCVDSLPAGSQYVHDEIGWENFCFWETITAMENKNVRRQWQSMFSLGVAVCVLQWI